MTALLALAVYWFCLPRPLFEAPVSTVLEDRSGHLLGARIASDGQWRFPPLDSAPEKFAQAIIEFEDRRFYRHPGFDPLALLRALRQNLRAGAIVSGGSTLSMQVIRMARGNPPRTILRKISEIIQATRLELTYSKTEIMALYASHAPFGGNVVGLEAAAWRYYGKSPQLLSWGEAATLAVLPNSPALIHPGRNREALLRKRNALLERMHQRGAIDSLGWRLARQEPLPETPLALPQLAPHLLQRAGQMAGANTESAPSRIRSTLQLERQRQLNAIVARHHRKLKQNQIHNLAALIIDIRRNEVIAYTGNAPETGDAQAEDVDIITAPRSTGSILKPFLYTLTLQEGLILPTSLLPDLPTSINGYQPKNFDRSFRGAVPANEALTRSLNVPMVHLLRSYGLEKFHYELQQLGLNQVDRPPDHYGLTLILGGAESSLWEVTNAYAGMARSLHHFYDYDSHYRADDFEPAHFMLTKGATSARPVLLAEAPRLSAAGSWLAFAAMQELERPDTEGEWRRFRSSQQIAWKTGTSFGFRDAWAVGVTPRYAIGVWAGNADGEGRPGLVGIRTAGPVLFDILDMLPGGESWFDPPYDEMQRLAICSNSGFRATERCPADTIWAPNAGRHAPACSFHRTIHLDSTGQWRVNALCELPAAIRADVRFVLPPLQAHYYRRLHPEYSELPPFRPGCRTAGEPVMELRYPQQPTRIFIPLAIDGQRSRAVFTVAHRQANTTIHWHLDQQYLGSTNQFHSMELDPAPGHHRLILVDEKGNRLEREFEVVPRALSK